MLEAPVPTVFSTVSKRKTIILAITNLLSANAFISVTTKILLFGERLTYSKGVWDLTLCHTISSFKNPEKVAF